MIFLGKGTFTRQFIHAIISIALRLFFRRIEAVNVENVPPNGAIIFVLNHPNGLVDPALVFVSLSRRVSFLAKSTLFQMPVISFLLKTVDALPLYRRVEKNAMNEQNQKVVREYQSSWIREYQMIGQAQGGGGGAGGGNR